MKHTYEVPVPKDNTIVLANDLQNALRLLETRRRKTRPKSPASLNIFAAGDHQTVRGVRSLVGMKEWLQALGHTVWFSMLSTMVLWLFLPRTGWRCEQSKHNTRNWNERERKHLCFHSLFSSCTWTKNWVSKTYRDVYLSSFAMHQGEDTDWRWSHNGGPLYAIFFWGLGTPCITRVRAKYNWNETTSLSAASRPVGFPHIHTGKVGGSHNWDPSRRGIRCHKYHTKPIVTGITSLGLDHVVQLGPSIENIAWHKAGIFKPGAPAFSVPQDPGPAQVMCDHATEKKTTLAFISVKSSFPLNSKVLSVPVQRLNCFLALELAKTFLQSKASDHTITDEDTSEGTRKFSWLGRFEVIEDGNSLWFLDGAHNTLSLKQSAEWFSKHVNDMNVQRWVFGIYSEE